MARRWLVRLSLAASAILACSALAAGAADQPAPVPIDVAAPIPVKTSSAVLQSSRVAEATVRHPGVRMKRDDGSHPLTVPAPLPQFDGPQAPIGAKLVDLSDQFLPGYYATGAPVTTACRTGVSPLLVGLAPSMSLKAGSQRAVLSADGCSGSADASVLAYPYPEGVWRTPANGAVGDGVVNSIDFFDKYGDWPDMHWGWLWFDIWGEPKQGTLIDPGGQSTYPLSQGLGSGTYSWQHWAEDSETGAVTPYRSAGWALYINKAPGAPGISSPSNGAVVKTLQPALMITAASDVESDSLGYAFYVSTNASCSAPYVATSGEWLPSGTLTWTVPIGVLSDGGTYYWCARATDFVARNYGGGQSPKSAVGKFTVTLSDQGIQPYWPMFQRGPLAVNEASGNLVLSVPGPQFASAAGTIGAGFTFNLIDSRPTVFSTATGSSWSLSVPGTPIRLIDHSLLSGVDYMDAVERIEPDGSNRFYTHVAGGNTYRSPAGDLSLLVKAGTGFTLTDPDGSLYTFGAATAGGLARLQESEQLAAKSSQARLVYTYDGSNRLVSITAKARNSAGTEVTLQTLTLTWSCTGAVVCIEGPSATLGAAGNERWKYVGDGAGGTSGKLVTVNDGTRNVLGIAYDGAGLPTSVKNANDLDPTSAGPGYSTTHLLQIAYASTSPNRVTSITETGVRDRYYGASPRSLAWLFTYGTASCPDSLRTAHAATSPHVASTAAGCTDIRLPEVKASNGAANYASVFYDAQKHPIEVVDPLGRWTLSRWNDRHTLDWSEDQASNSTDYTYDPFTYALTKVEGPDPDGAGTGLPRPTTEYFYDERAPGNGTTVGLPLQGLQAYYYANAELTGRPQATRTDASVNFDWRTSGPTELGGANTNIGVRWTGILTVPATADYVLATASDEGTRLFVDGVPLITGWTGKTYAIPECSSLVQLAGGRHAITLEYHKSSGASAARVELRWTAGGAATCGNATTVIPSSALTPNWQNRTSTLTLGSSASGSAKRLSFSHFTRQSPLLPDYTAADATVTPLITTFAYDDFGRVTSRVTPKGNAARTIGTTSPNEGDLSGSATAGYSVAYDYYPADATGAGLASACSVTSGYQYGLPKSIVPYGVSPTTTVYDVRGRPVATTKAAGTTCRTYDAENRLASETAPGEGTATTYAYDPAGRVRTITSAAGTVTNVYDESGLLIDTVDSFGAEMEVVYNRDGNPTKRRVATGALGSSTVYDTDYTYNDNGQLVKQVFLPSQATPANRTYEFSWDTRGNLIATRYPNSTFSWNVFNAAGWLLGTYNRHGALASPPPTGAVPNDSTGNGNALSDFVYAYFADGRRASETRTGQGFGTGELATYAYDSVGRLSGVSGAYGRTYCFDRNSNRTSYYASSGQTCGGGSPTATYQYSSTVLDQLQSVTTGGVTTPYGYDADGQTTSRGGDAIGWDTRGRHNGATVSPGSLQYLVDGATTGVTPGSSTTSSFGATSNIVVDASGSDKKSVSRYTATATGTVDTGRVYLGGTTQTVTLNAADADDGSGFKGGPSYASLGAAAYTADDNALIAVSRTSAWQYFADNAYVRFDTSGIPDGATVTSAKLRVDMISKLDTDGLSLVGDYYDFGGEPSVNADFTVGQQADAFTKLISTMPTGVNTIDLSNLTSVSKTGWTGIRLKESQRAGDAAPTGSNEMLFGASEHTSAAAPQLEVTYTVPQDVRMVVYANNAGAPGALLAQSTARTFPSDLAPGWQTFSFPTPPSVTNATDYWVGLQWGPGGVINAYKDSAASGTAGTEQWNADAFGDGAAGTFGTPTAGTVKRSLDLTVSTGASTSFDSTLFTNGWHTLTAVATSSGKQATSAARVVRVQNGPASVDKLANLGATTQTGGSGSPSSFGATSNIVVDASGSDKKSVSRYTATATGTVSSGRLYLGGTTQTITLNAADADDGSGFKGDPVYASLGAAAYTADDNALIAVSRTSAWQYFADNAYVRFDTSGIPDGATVMSAKLRLDLVSKLDTDGLSLVGDYYDFGGEPSVNADFTVGQQSDAFSRLISTMPTGVNTIDLANLAGVSKTGWTGIRLKESQRAGDAAPSGLNEVLFGASEHTSAAAPQLEVTYTVPQDVRMVIYANNAGAPGALLAQSTARTFPSDLAPGWQTFTFPTPPSVTNATDYWVGLQWGPGAVINAYKDSIASGTSGTEQSNTDTFSDGAASTFGTPTAGTAKRSLDLTVTGTGGSATTALTTTNAAPVGSTVIVAVNAEGVTLSSVTDSRGNTYTIDRATVTNANSTAARVSLASSRLTTAVQAGDTITATFSAATASVRSITAAAFSGLLTNGTATDVGATGTSTAAGTAPATSATATTAYSTELVIGAIGAASTATLTPGSGYAAAGSTSASSGGISLGVHLEWKAALTKTTQTATGTLSASSHWAAAVQTYKPTDTTTPGTPGTPTATGGTGVATVTWTASAEAGVMYRVYRGTTSGFAPGSGNEVGQTTALSYVDSGDGSTSGLPAGTYYYKVLAEDVNGNQSTAVGASNAATVTVDTGIPRVALTAPAALAVVGGGVSLAATTDVTSGSVSVVYVFDPMGFRRSRALSGAVTRYLLGGLIETTGVGVISGFDVDGPAGDLARYGSAPSSSVNPTYVYYSGHGDLAAEADQAGTRTSMLRLDAFGQPLAVIPGSGTSELFTGRWDKKTDLVSGLIEMGVRPYDPSLGRFYSTDPVDGGSCNQYDYSCQDPINDYDLTGLCGIFTIIPCDPGHTAEQAVLWLLSYYCPKCQKQVVMGERGAQSLDDHNLRPNQVLEAIRSSRGEYHGFKYDYHGNTRIGYYDPKTEILAITKPLGDIKGRPTVELINAFRVDKSYVRRLIEK